MKKEVLVVFKTHLDIGFTDFSANVVKNYLENYIPNAIKVGRALKGTDTPFIWTVGSWLIWEALKHDSDKLVENAINDGIISWHALPCTTHTELMNKELFEYGISLSKKLDERFGRTTIGSKMTDVPGHTLGMVPLMAKNGIKFMHIGVNPVTPNPEVPTVFKWKCGDSELVVMYAGLYGTNEDFGDFVIAFAHTNDNLGPQSPDEIIKIYDELREQYPGYEIKAATLNDVAEKVLTLKNLPVVEDEIGDTWIHGAGTDPKKVGMYREILRHIEENGISGDISDNLLLVPEHTWGMCLEKFFNNSTDWMYEDFKNSKDTERKEMLEKSWEEQRSYVKKAAEVLGVNADYEVKLPDLAGYTEVTDFSPCFEVSWQLFDVYNYNWYVNKYIDFIRYDCAGWGTWDYTKPGLPVYSGGIFAATPVSCHEKDGKRIYRLEFEKELAEKHALPYFIVYEADGKFEFDMIGKGANRLPQAFWLKFKGMDEKWEINKLSQWINPERIIASPLITAFDKGVRNKDFTIISKDACLAAPFGRRLLDFELNPDGQDMYFNLYNNIWNTNFPMWYSDDTRYRFEIVKR